jgi:hypothetical protein
MEFHRLPGHAHRKIRRRNPGYRLDACRVSANGHCGWRNRWGTPLDHRVASGGKGLVVILSLKTVNKMPLHKRGILFTIP